MSRYAAGLLVILLGLSAPRALPIGEPASLPVEMPIDRNIVDVDLRLGKVEVTIDDQRAPSLTVEDTLRQPQTRGSVLIGRDATTLAIAQPPADDGRAPRWRVTLVLHSNQRLHITGSTLTVGVEASGAGKPRAAGAVLTSLLHIDPSDSEIQVRGVSALVLGGANNHVTAHDIGGLVQARLERGQLALEDQRGGVTLDTHDTDVQLTRTAGTIQSTLDGGQLAVTDSSGSMQVSGSSAAVVLDKWSGPVKISGEMLHVEARRCKAAEGLLRIEGRDPDVVLEDLSIDLELDVTGGGVTARHVAGQVRIVASGAALDLDLSTAAGTPELELSGSTTARVTLRDPCLVRVDGDAEDTDARLQVTGCEYKGAGGQPDGRVPLQADGGQPLEVLTVKLDESARADVRGVRQ